MKKRKKPRGLTTLERAKRALERQTAREEAYAAKKAVSDTKEAGQAG